MQFYNKFSNFTVTVVTCFTKVLQFSVDKKDKQTYTFFPACKSADLRRAGQ